MAYCDSLLVDTVKYLYRPVLCDEKRKAGYSTHPDMNDTSKN